MTPELAARLDDFYALAVDFGTIVIVLACVGICVMVFNSVGNLR